MNFFRWRRARKIRHCLKYVRNLQTAYQCACDALKSLQASQAYQPICLGGLEDRYAGITEAEGAYSYWDGKCRYWLSKLKIDMERARKFL